VRRSSPDFRFDLCLADSRPPVRGFGFGSCACLFLWSHVVVRRQFFFLPRRCPWILLGLVSVLLLAHRFLCQVLAAVWPGLSCFVFHLVSPCAQGLGSVRSPDEVPALTCFPARPLFFLLLVKLRSSLVPFIPARVGPVSNCSDCTGLFWSLARAFFGFYFIFVVVLFFFAHKLFDEMNKRL
jgi:hypothetical protein